MYGCFEAKEAIGNIYGQTLMEQARAFCDVLPFSAPLQDSVAHIISNNKIKLNH